MKPDQADAVLRKQRRDIARLNAMQSALAEKSKALIDNVSNLRELADAAAALERLGRIAERLIPLERQAFHLDEAAEAGSPGLAELLKRARERLDGTETENQDR
ncbi:MAG: hypothetical protein M0006_03870 [Magnetospirillum sp.]|nr:hypothetical protein [Magnetospirillum sp.]